ncbi:MAG TPA: methyltransferase domain-containing protein [Burkholderiales bacterium]|nr:methyltransferase domain-containing protein [Burkholderiales bacterium]
MRKHASLWLTVALASGGAAAQDALKDLDTPYVPTPQVVVDRMLDMAKLKPGETVIDLGSGDGRIMIEAASKYGARGFGVEIDPRLVKLSNERAVEAGVADRVKFLQQDLFKTDFRKANVLTLYLLPDVNLALRPKILAELRPGSRVVSHDYGMGDWRPDAEATIPAPDKKVGARKESQVFMWTVPAKVAGKWRLELTIDGQTHRLRLSLRQRYQFLSGSLSGEDGQPVPLTDGKILGEDLRLTLPAGVGGPEPVKLEGRVERDRSAGVVKRTRGEDGTWRALRGSSMESTEDGTLQPYVHCDGFAGGVRGVALDRRPAGAAPWREVGLDAKTERVSVLDGYRGPTCSRT